MHCDEEQKVKERRWRWRWLKFEKERTGKGLPPLRISTMSMNSVYALQYDQIKSRIHRADAARISSSSFTVATSRGYDDAKDEERREKRRRKKKKRRKRRKRRRRRIKCRGRG
ncbi:hypothetical protein V1478_008206 [Vespula squamosa]|uniref:Uncharacterized protein n=1 Tax=Vespula squamosa TaxID=30214 RepID=A0ABD2AY46_VESSQ